MKRYQDIEFIHQKHDRDYPVQYLISRIKGRRTQLITDWDNLVFGKNPLEYLRSTRYGALTHRDTMGEAWNSFLQELSWVHSQMNGRLLEVFWPYCLYNELRTVLFCLRYKQSKGTEEKIERLFAPSLLSNLIKDMIRKSDEVLPALQGIENVFVHLSPHFKGLQKAFIKGDMKMVEQQLIDSYLEYIMSARIHPVINWFFISAVDLRNIMAVYKQLKWGISVHPTFLTGGIVRVNTLKRIVRGQNISDLIPLIYHLTSLRVTTITSTSVENSLLKGLTKRIRLRGRTSDIAFILAYLWRCYIESRNINLILYGRELEREVISGELIH